MERGSSTKNAAAVLLFWAALYFPVFAQTPANQAANQAASAAKAVPRFEYRAILVRGSEAVKGLPNFGRNALPGIYGEYRLERAVPARDASDEKPASPIRVWMTREALFLAPASWTQERFGGKQSYTASAALSSEEKPLRLRLFDRPFSAEGQGADPKLWTVIIGFPEASVPEDSARADRFVPAFLDKLSYFLSNARSPGDASFPAIIEF